MPTSARKFQFAGDPDRRLALTPAGKVLTWGSVPAANLGVRGQIHNSTQPQQIPGLPPLRAIAGSRDAALGLDEKGYAWTWGRCTKLFGGPDVFLSHPFRIDGLADLRSVAVIDRHLFFTNQAGESFTGAFVPPDEKPSFYADPFYLPAPMKKIVGARGQVFALSEAGIIYPLKAISTFPATFTFTPMVASRPIHGLPFIKDIASGPDWHHLALSRDGFVYAWGNNAFGELGLGLDESRANRQIAVPTLIPTLKNITQIACAFYVSLARDVHGNIYTWGVDYSTIPELDTQISPRQADILFASQGWLPQPHVLESVVRAVAASQLTL
jgi:alpha-tubulin suppressor-like RCC1 family protein